MATSEIPFPEQDTYDLDVIRALGLMESNGVSFSEAMDKLGYRTAETAKREVELVQVRGINPFDQDISHTT